MSQPIVGIDASRAVRKHRTGVENYSWELLRQLSELPADFRLRLYAPHKPTEPFPSSKNIEWKIIPDRHLWSQVALSNETRKDPPDLLFIPSHVMPFLTTCQAVVTVHDLGYEYYPMAYPKFDRRYMRLTTKFAVKRCKKIIVPSEQTKKDLINFYHASPSSIVVTPLGYQPPTCPVQKRPQTEPYLLYVGRLEEKKNLTTLLTAFKAVAAKNKTITLVLIGKPGHGYQRIEQLLQTFSPELRKRIIFPGFVDEKTKFAYLQHAEAFVFPSLYEGFGLAVLEAMATGLPVICSNSSSLPEVTADAALLVKPNDITAWSEAITTILSNQKLTSSYRQKALERSKLFTWKKCALQTQQVLRDALS